MTSSGNTWTRVAGPMATTVRPRKYAVGWYRLASWLFGHGTVCETVATRLHFDASPAAVWNHIMFYEEVPGRPPFLLRALLPRPVRTDGNKTRVGAIVRCTYREGDLLKRITSLEPPHFLGFAVIEQSLGIEDCVLTLRGSYEIFACGNASDVVLITNYQAHLRPRYLWRLLEGFLVSQLHRHILRGVRAALTPANPDKQRAVADSYAPQRSAPRGDLPCTALPSCSRR